MNRIYTYIQSYPVYASGLVLVMILMGWYFLFFSKTKNIVPVRRGNLIEAVYGLGTVTSSKVYHLKIGVSSSIKKLYVEEGDKIQAGQPLVEFDTIGRMASPISGIVTSMVFKQGETVFPQMNVITVTDLSSKYILLLLEEQGAVKVKIGQKARISFETLSGRVISGNVKSLYPASDGQFAVKIDSHEIPLEILPGMTADVAIETANRENVILIPNKSLKNNKVTLLRAGKKIITPVTTGVPGLEYSEVLTGDVQEGDEILLPSKK